MALLVTGSYPTPYSTTPLSTSYWRWVGLGIDVTTMTATLTLYAYESEAAFNAGKTSIGQKQFNVSGADFGTIAYELETTGTPGLSTIIYNYIKTHDEFFAEATDTDAVA